MITLVFCIVYCTRSWVHILYRVSSILLQTDALSISTLVWVHVSFLSIFLPLLWICYSLEDIWTILAPLCYDILFAIYRNNCLTINNLLWWKFFAIYYKMEWFYNIPLFSIFISIGMFSDSRILFCKLFARTVCFMLYQFTVLLYTIRSVSNQGAVFRFIVKMQCTICCSPIPSLISSVHYFPCTKDTVVSPRLTSVRVSYVFRWLSKFLCTKSHVSMSTST